MEQETRKRVRLMLLMLGYIASSLSNQSTFYIAQSCVIYQPFGVPSRAVTVVG